MSYQYNAFISYRHAQLDSRIAAEVQTQLERMKIPKDVQQLTGSKSKMCIRDRYYPGDSPLHRMDPRMKIVVAMVFIVAIFLVKTWWGYLAVLLFFLLGLFVSRLPVKFMLKSVKPLLFIIILTFVLNLFLSPEGNALFQWGFLRVTDRGLEMAAMLSLRLIFLVISASLLPLTTSPIALTDGIERLLSPVSYTHLRRGGDPF